MRPRPTRSRRKLVRDDTCIEEGFDETPRLADSFLILGIEWFVPEEVHATLRHLLFYTLGTDPNAENFEDESQCRMQCSRPVGDRYTCV